MKRKTTGLAITLITACTLFTSCVSFDKGWKYMAEKERNENIAEVLEKALSAEQRAGRKEDVLELVSLYKIIEKTEPDNYFALWKIGHYNLLLGAAHSPSKRDKKHYYREAIKYFEKAMFTNDAFKAAVLDGEKIVVAAQHLTKNEIDAMGYWYTARFYYFKDCMSATRRAFNTKIVRENNEMIALIDKLDSKWAGGGNYFSRALYYIALPERFGGSKEKAAEQFEQAISIGPDYLVNRWGRAKYLYSITGNKEGFISDLKWVIAQDPKRDSNPHAWNVYFQKDAKEMLDKEGIEIN